MTRGEQALSLKLSVKTIVSLFCVKEDITSQVHKNKSPMFLNKDIGNIVSEATQQLGFVCFLPEIRGDVPGRGSMSEIWR